MESDQTNLGKVSGGPEFTEADLAFMREAMAEADAAARQGEVPVGAVIVKDGEVIARAHNLVETLGSSGAHAEMLAIRSAEEATGFKWLSGCSLYVTLEPCSMCAGAIVLSRLDRLYIGTMDPKNGACGSLSNIVCDPRLNHRVEVVRGLMAEECSRQLKDFFRERRERRLERNIPKPEDRR